MITIHGRFKQDGTADQSELDYPLVIGGRSFTPHLVTLPGNDDAPDITVCVMTPVGSQEEENMSNILHINDGIPEDSELREYDFDITGSAIIPDAWRLSHPEDEKYQMYNDAIGRLSISDTEQLYADMYIIANSVVEVESDGEYVVSFNAGCTNLYFKDVEGGVSKTTGKSYDAFTAHTLGVQGWTPDGNRSLGSIECRLARGHVANSVTTVRETSMNEGDFLGGCTAAGFLRFIDASSEDEEKVKPILNVTHLLIGTVVNSGNNSKVIASPAVKAPKERSAAQQSVKARMDKMKAKSKAKAPEFTQGEDF